MEDPFSTQIRELIRQSDIVLEVLDARFIEKSRNQRVESLIKKGKKPIIYVLNKCDLVKDKKELSKIKKRLMPSVFISSTKYFGIKILKNLIIEKSKSIKKKRPKIGVIGYPNVGKSSLINALKGRASVKISSEAGFTKGLQWINIENKFLLIDSPGIISFEDHDVSTRMKMGAQRFFTTDKHLIDVLGLVEENYQKISRYYEVKPEKNPEKLIENIAKKRKMLLKGNRPDTERAMRAILKDMSDGKLNIF